MKLRTKFLIFTLLLLIGSLAHAYQSPFAVSFETGKLKVASGSEIETSVIIRVPAGHFLYKDKTELSFTALDGIHVKAINYPKSVAHRDPVTGKSVEIYPEGEVTISVMLSAPADMAMGERNLSAYLEFQGCEEKLCLRPEEHTIDWKVSVSHVEGVITEEYKEHLEESSFSFKDLLNTRDFTDVISKGKHIALLIAFIAGLLTSLTPCVWPLIPVMLLIIGIHKRGQFFGNMALSFSLVAGIAVTYSILGIAASVAGAQIGFLFQQKIFIVFVVIFLVAMSLSMFGLFSIQLPQSARNALSKIGGKGYRGAFLSGISIGLLATPCVGPVLGPMLVWVASKKEYLFGAELLAIYALGLGVFYIVVGTFYGTLAGKIKNVKAGNVVKKILGLVLLIPAIYYLNSIIPTNGFINGGIEWRTDEPSAIVESLSESKPMMVVFGARWCPPCEKLEKDILSDKKVVGESKKFVPLHVDATANSDEIERILDKYHVIGWPTILFVSPGGKVYDDLSLVGDVPNIDELLDVMSLALKRTK